MLVSSKNTVWISDPTTGRLLQSEPVSGTAVVTARLIQEDMEVIRHIVEEVVEKAFRKWLDTNLAANEFAYEHLRDMAKTSLPMSDERLAGLD